MNYNKVPLAYDRARILNNPTYRKILNNLPACNQEIEEMSGLYQSQVSNLLIDSYKAKLVTCEKIGKYCIWTAKKDVVDKCYVAIHNFIESETELV